MIGDSALRHGKVCGRGLLVEYESFPSASTANFKRQVACHTKELAYLACDEFLRLDDECEVSEQN